MSREDNALLRIERLLVYLANKVTFLEHQVEAILDILEQQPVQAESATLTLVDAKGNIMPLTVHVNDTPGMAIFTEFDGPNGTGNKVPPVGAVSFTSSDATIATVDASSGKLAYLAAGSTTISGSDAGNNLSASDVLTVVASVAVSATLTLQPGA